LTVAADAVSVPDLYARWERGNWRATEIDFSADREHWRERFTDLQRRAALWNYSLFLHGEDAVADSLSPFIDAAPRAEQRYFLATQQVDEARHAVFFARFMNEVAGIGGDLATSLEATRPQLTWGFRQVFERLTRVTDELRRDRSRPKLAQAVALYHVIVEGVLAQPGQHFIESYLEHGELLPGFRSGMRNVALDEQRHIGFGVTLLAELVREDPECRPAVEELLREIVPLTVSVFAPPHGDERYVTCFGFTLTQVYEEGTRSMEARLRAAGLEPG
jgi:ribonucleotide reductase beta subunit family protein with ferritin-like domain